MNIHDRQQALMKNLSILWLELQSDSKTINGVISKNTHDAFKAVELAQKEGRNNALVGLYEASAKPESPLLKLLTELRPAIGFSLMIETSESLMIETNERSISPVATCTITFTES